MLVQRPLHAGWTVRSDDGDPATGAPAVPVPATVPGCVHTDLLAAGLIPDPYLDDNETRLAWIGRTAWIYEMSFDADTTTARRIDLVAEGLDTVATVTLNDAEIGRTTNMHRAYRFDVTGLIRPSDNRLTVRFDSAYAYAEQVRNLLGPRPNAYDEPFQYIRKMASNFGWDWGPTLVTAGIWQPLRLEAWSTARLAQVRPLLTVDGTTGCATVHVTLERATDVPLTVTAAVVGRTATVTVPAGATHAVVTVDVPAVRRWQPRGHGEPHRYELTVTLRDPAASVLDVWQRHVGFRSVHLDTAADQDGTPFVLHVNDVPVYVRGVNWIPDDAFVTRVDRARYAARIRQAVDAGVNYLRVWGGGRYEGEDFYDLADELGVLVGQDFLFACAAYPEEDPIGAEVAAEARHQVVRLAPHPSLVMWVGNNENLWGWHDWDWQDPLAGRSWGRGFYLDLLPGIVTEQDPTRPYWPGSPWSGREDLHPNDPAHGTTHIWDVWNTHDYRHYRTYRPRFVAEFGYQAPPTYATLRRAISDGLLAPDSPGVVRRQKAIDGNGKLTRGLIGHFPAPTGFDDWLWSTQLNQARAIAFGIAHFRSLRPLCAGTILWQLNDNWPVTSWAAVDGDGRRKPVWYALRRVYADRLLTVQPRDGELALVALNDSAEPWRAQLEARRATFAGDPKAKSTFTIDIAPGAVATVQLPMDITVPDDPANELVVIDGDGDRALWFFAEDLDLAYPAFDADVVVRDVPGGLTVEVTARGLIRDLALFPDRLDPAATVDEQLVTLLPGEHATFHVATTQRLDHAALATRPVLRSANDLVRRPASSGQPGR
jgi:beta-mannosidase